MPAIAKKAVATYLAENGLKFFTAQSFFTFDQAMVSFYPDNIESLETENNDLYLLIVGAIACKNSKCVDFASLKSLFEKLKIDVNYLNNSEQKNHILKIMGETANVNATETDFTKKFTINESEFQKKSQELIAVTSDEPEDEPDSEDGPVYEVTGLGSSIFGASSSETYGSIAGGSVVVATPVQQTIELAFLTDDQKQAVKASLFQFYDITGNSTKQHELLQSSASEPLYELVNGLIICESDKSIKEQCLQRKGLLSKKELVLERVLAVGAIPSENLSAKNAKKAIDDWIKNEEKRGINGLISRQQRECESFKDREPQHDSGLGASEVSMIESYDVTGDSTGNLYKDADDNYDELHLAPKRGVRHRPPGGFPPVPPARHESALEESLYAFIDTEGNEADNPELENPHYNSISFKFEPWLRNLVESDIENDIENDTINRQKVNNVKEVLGDHYLSLQNKPTSEIFNSDLLRNMINGAIKLAEPGDLNIKKEDFLKSDRSGELDPAKVRALGELSFAKQEITPDSINKKAREYTDLEGETQRAVQAVSSRSPSPTPSDLFELNNTEEDPSMSDDNQQTINTILNAIRAVGGEFLHYPGKADNYQPKFLMKGALNRQLSLGASIKEAIFVNFDNEHAEFKERQIFVAGDSSTPSSKRKSFRTAPIKTEDKYELSGKYAFDNLYLLDNNDDCLAALELQAAGINLKAFAKTDEVKTNALIAMYKEFNEEEKPDDDFDADDDEKVKTPILISFMQSLTPDQFNDANLDTIKEFIEEITTFNDDTFQGLSQFNSEIESVMNDDKEITPTFLDETPVKIQHYLQEISRLSDKAQDLHIPGVEILDHAKGTMNKIVGNLFTIGFHNSTSLTPEFINLLNDPSIPSTDTFNDWRLDLQSKLNKLAKLQGIYNEIDLIKEITNKNYQEFLNLYNDAEELIAKIKRPGNGLIVGIQEGMASPEKQALLMAAQKLSKQTELSELLQKISDESTLFQAYFGEDTAQGFENSIVVMQNMNNCIEGLHSEINQLADKGVDVTDANELFLRFKERCDIYASNTAWAFNQDFIQLVNQQAGIIDASNNVEKVQNSIAIVTAHFNLGNPIKDSASKLTTLDGRFLEFEGAYPEFATQADQKINQLSNPSASIPLSLLTDIESVRAALINEIDLYAQDNKIDLSYLQDMLRRARPDFSANFKKIWDYNDNKIPALLTLSALRICDSNRINDLIDVYNAFVDCYESLEVDAFTKPTDLLGHHSSDTIFDVLLATEYFTQEFNVIDSESERGDIIRHFENTSMNPILRYEIVKLIEEVIKDGVKIDKALDVVSSYIRDMPNPDALNNLDQNQPIIKAITEKLDEAVEEAEKITDGSLRGEVLFEDITGYLRDSGVGPENYEQDFVAGSFRRLDRHAISTLETAWNNAKQGHEKVALLLFFKAHHGSFQSFATKEKKQKMAEYLPSATRACKYLGWTKIAANEELGAYVWNQPTTIFDYVIYLGTEKYTTTFSDPDHLKIDIARMLEPLAANILVYDEIVSAIVNATNEKIPLSLALKLVDQAIQQILAEERVEAADRISNGARDVTIPVTPAFLLKKDPVNISPVTEKLQAAKDAIAQFNRLTGGVDEAWAAGHPDVFAGAIEARIADSSDTNTAVIAWLIKQKPNSLDPLQIAGTKENFERLSREAGVNNDQILAADPALVTALFQTVQSVATTKQTEILKHFLLNNTLKTQGITPQGFLAIAGEAAAAIQDGGLGFDATITAVTTFFATPANLAEFRKAGGIDSSGLNTVLTNALRTLTTAADAVKNNVKAALEANISPDKHPEVGIYLDVLSRKVAVLTDDKQLAYLAYLTGATTVDAKCAIAHLGTKEILDPRVITPDAISCYTQLSVDEREMLVALLKKGVTTGAAGLTVDAVKALASRGKTPTLLQVMVNAYTHADANKNEIVTAIQKNNGRNPEADIVHILLTENIVSHALGLTPEAIEAFAKVADDNNRIRIILSYAAGPSTFRPEFISALNVLTSAGINANQVTMLPAINLLNANDPHSRPKLLKQSPEATIIIIELVKQGVVTPLDDVAAAVIALRSIYNRPLMGSSNAKELVEAYKDAPDKRSFIAGIPELKAAIPADKLTSAVIIAYINAGTPEKKAVVIALAKAGKTTGISNDALITALAKIDPGATGLTQIIIDWNTYCKDTATQARLTTAINALFAGGVTKLTAASAPIYIYYGQLANPLSATDFPHMKEAIIAIAKAGAPSGEYPAAHWSEFIEPSSIAARNLANGFVGQLSKVGDSTHREALAADFVKLLRNSTERNNFYNALKTVNEIYGDVAGKQKFKTLALVQYFIKNKLNKASYDAWSSAKKEALQRLTSESTTVNDPIDLTDDALNAVTNMSTDISITSDVETKFIKGIVSAANSVGTPLTSADCDLIKQLVCVEDFPSAKLTKQLLATLHGATANEAGLTRSLADLGATATVYKDPNYRAAMRAFSVAHIPLDKLSLLWIETYKAEIDPFKRQLIIALAKSEAKPDATQAEIQSMVTMMQGVAVTPGAVDALKDSKNLAAAVKHLLAVDRKTVAALTSAMIKTQVETAIAAPAPATRKVSTVWTSATRDTKQKAVATSANIAIVRASGKFNAESFFDNLEHLKDNEVIDSVSYKKIGPAGVDQAIDLDAIKLTTAGAAALRDSIVREAESFKITLSGLGGPAEDQARVVTHWVNPQPGKTLANGQAAQKNDYELSHSDQASLEQALTIIEAGGQKIIDLTLLRHTPKTPDKGAATVRDTATAGSLIKEFDLAINPLGEPRNPEVGEVKLVTEVKTDGNPSKVFLLTEKEAAIVIALGRGLNVKLNPIDEHLKAYLQPAIDSYKKALTPDAAPDLAARLVVRP